MLIIFCTVPTFARDNETVSEDKIFDKTSYGWTTQKERIRERNRLKRAPYILEEYENYKIKPIYFAFDSFILPGRGQLNLNQKRKGWSVRISFWGTMLYGLYHFARSNDYYHNYETASSLEDIKFYYRESNKSYRKAQVGLGIGTAIWIYNIYDAYKQAEAYNLRLFNEIRLSKFAPRINYNFNSEKLYISAKMEF